MSFFLVETVNYTEAGVQTALIRPCILPEMWKIFMAQERVQFHQALPLRSSLLFPPPPSQMSPAAQKLYYLQVNISNPNGG